MDAPRCTATSKQSGERCKRRPVPGLSVCVMHGGKAPAAQAKAAEVQLEQAADASLRKLWSGLANAAPVTNPVASLQRLAGALEQLVDESGAKVNDLRHLAGGEHLTQLRAEVVLFERALGHLRGLLVDMERLGIARIDSEIQQQQASIVVAAFRLALEQGDLLPAQRDSMVRAFLGALGRGPEVVAGAGAGEVL